MKNENFVAQLAQFSSLEQMQNLGESQAKSTHVAMIGKFVSGWDSEASLEVVGMVTGVVFDKSEPKLLVQTEVDDLNAISILRLVDVNEVLNGMPVDVPDSTAGEN